MALIDNVEAFWLCDETSGDREDATGNGMTLSESGSVTREDAFNGFKAAVFSSAFLTRVSASLGPLDPAGACSFSFWYKASGTFNINFWEITDANFTGFRISLNTNPVMQAFGPGTNSQTNSGPATGQWHHVVFTVPADSVTPVKVYVDGVDDTSGSTTWGTITDGSHDLKIGSGVADVSMTLIGFWSRVLTSDEVTDLYSGGDGLAYPFEIPEPETASVPVIGSSIHLGEFSSGKTIYIGFNTRNKTTGAPITLTDGDISIYKRGNATESTAGVTLSADYDSRTGYHVIAIDTSADAFYADANDFAAVLTAGAVDGVSVAGVEVGSFSLANRAGLRPTTADQTIGFGEHGGVLVDGAWDEVDETYAAFPAGLGSVNIANGGVSVRQIWDGATYQTLVVSAAGKVAATIAAGDLATDSVTAGAVKADAASKIAAATEAAILNEGDATALLAAIAAKVEAFLINDGDATATLAAIATAVWGNGTRVLTAGTNIVLSTDAIPAAAVSSAAVTKIQNGLATPTNITAGTITTVTTLTNAPSAGDFTAAMKTSLNAATPASVQNISAQTGDTYALANGASGFVATKSAVDAKASQASVDDLPTNGELAMALGTADDAVLAAIAALVIPTAAQNAAGVLDLANGVETGLTFREALRLIAAASAGKLSGAATTTIVIRNAVADNKNRITATVDSSGNRSAVVLDLS